MVMRALLVTTMAVIAGPARADDWPQWMGPARDDHWNETGIVRSLPPGGPKVLWRTPIRGGYSGPAVVDGRVFVTDYDTTGETTGNPGQRSDITGRERVLCLDATTGKQIWKHDYECKYKISYPAGPRCTPTVSGGKVYSLGAEGNLVCLDAASGSLIW